MPKLLSEKDIKKIWKYAVTITIKNVGELIDSGGVKPNMMSNGYFASLSIDDILDNAYVYHLSISNPSDKTDNKIAESMAEDILGEGYDNKGSMNHPNVIHFLKVKYKFDEELEEK